MKNSKIYFHEIFFLRIDFRAAQLLYNIIVQYISVELWEPRVNSSKNLTKVPLYRIKKFKKNFVKTLH